jgi:uncharacterized protein (DUF58 family)
MKGYQPFTFRFIRWLWRQWRYEVTPAGKALIAGTMFAVVGTVSVQPPVYQFFCALFVLLAVTNGAGMLMRPRVRLSGGLPLKSVAGQRVSGRFEIENTSRLPAYDVGLGFYGLPRSLLHVDDELSVSSVAAGASASLPVTILPRRRGFFELPPLRAYSMFPFGMARYGKSQMEMGALLVLPDFHPLSEIDIPVGSRYQPGGITLTSNVGESPEYIGNREYKPGDSPRRVDFRSWARLAKPVVKEYQEEYFVRVALIVDTFVPRFQVPSPPEGFPELEAAVSLTAAIANALAGGEYVLDIFAAGPELYVFRTGRHTAPFENVLEILACLDACRTNPFETIGPALAEEIGRISTAVCLFLDWNESRRQLVRSIQDAGCRAKTIVIHEGPTSEPIDGEVLLLTPNQIRSGKVDAL